MAKTVRGTIDLETLRDRLTKHCQKLPSYQRVESDTIEVRFFEDHIYLELRQPATGKCWHCEGTGRDYDYKHSLKRCFVCDGTGQRPGYDTTTARIIAKEYPKTGAKVAIEVNTEGKKLEVWKPAVERIKKFLEELVGEPCVQVILSKAEEVASKPNPMEMMERTVEAMK